MASRVCIVGAGAIGGIYAASLAALPELEVWACDASAEHVAAINERGLRLSGALELTGRVHARSDPAEIPPCELGILATKGTVTETAIAAVATAGVFADGAVCSVQNGIGNEELIAGHVGRVMRGVTLIAGRIVAPGVIDVDALARTWIGPFEPAPASAVEVDRLAGLLAAAGLDAEALPDARGAQWTKLLFNAATNPLCALTGLTTGPLRRLPGTGRLMDDLIEEGLAVAAALGIDPGSDPRAMIDQEARVNPDHRPSMLQDIAARRATEIATLNGGIVAAGRACGVATPLHEAIVALVEAVEHGWAR